MDQAQLLASIAATTQDCILSVDLEGRILWATPATEEVVGWRPDELLGRHISVIVPEEALEVQEHAVGQLLAGEEVPPFVDVRCRRDGTEIEALVTLGAVRDAAGRVIGVTGILRDVSEEMSAQRELQLALEMSRARFVQVHTAQALLDLKGRLRAVNPAWCELTGYPEAELVGRAFEDLIHPMDSVRTAEQLDPLRTGDAESASGQVVVRAADGRSLALLLDATLLRDPEGRPHSVAVFARSLTQVQGAEERLAAQEGLYRALERRGLDAAAVADRDLNIVYVTPSLAALLGYEPIDVLMMDGWEFVHPDDAVWLGPLVEDLLAHGEGSGRVLVRVRDAGGRWRSVETTLTNCLADPDIGGLVINLRDVTEQVEAERALRLSEALHRAMVETAQEGILATGADGEVLFANEMLSEILGIPVDDLQRMDAHGLIAPEPGERSGSPSRYETTYPHPDGAERVLEVTCSPLTTDDTGTHGSLCMVSDVTEARQAVSALRRQALHDPLTGLPNRYLFLDRLEMAAARQSRSGGTTGLLFLDLDGFKAVNDQHGHQGGDDLLREVADRLVGAVRTADTVGRLGGDEFAIICEEADEAAALLVAERVHEALGRPVRLPAGPAEDSTVEVSTSIGVALAPPSDFADVLRHADEAMYVAKDRGRGGTAVYRSASASGSAVG